MIGGPTPRVDLTSRAIHPAVEPTPSRLLGAAMGHSPRENPVVGGDCGRNCGCWFIINLPQTGPMLDSYSNPGQRPDPEALVLRITHRMRRANPGTMADFTPNSAIFGTLGRSRGASASAAPALIGDTMAELLMKSAIATLA